MSNTEELPNFLRLYEELGVRPDDGVGRLTERYRARMRALHPDTRGADSDKDRTTYDLGWLSRCYREALAFERRHGRLPGAASELPAGVVADAGGDGAWPLVRRTRSGGTPGARSRRVREAAEQGLWRWRWMLAATALALTLLAIAGGP